MCQIGGTRARCHYVTSKTRLPIRYRQVFTFCHREERSVPLSKNVNTVLEVLAKYSVEVDAITIRHTMSSFYIRKTEYFCLRNNGNSGYHFRFVLPCTKITTNNFPGHHFVFFYARSACFIASSEEKKPREYDSLTRLFCLSLPLN